MPRSCLRLLAALLAAPMLSGCMNSVYVSAANGDDMMLSRLLARGYTANEVVVTQTPLMEASRNGHAAAVKMLLEHGAEVDAENSHGDRALTYAVYYDHPDVVTELLAHDAEVRDHERELASQRGYTDIEALLVGDEEAATEESAPQPAAERPAPERSSDVDSPSYKKAARPGDFALIVGIEKYSALPDARFAERDAEAVHRHVSALGIPERNIIVLKGGEATRGKLQGYLKEWLPKNVKPDSTLFVYFSGHGAPDPKTGDAYLVPWDGDARFLQSTAYPLADFYEALRSLHAKSVVVALDACFSGAGGRSVLAPGTRPLVTRAADVPAEGLTVLAAASSDETTGTIDDQGHGAFTYYLLKGLDSGKRSARGLFEYLKPLVQDEAHRQNREQTPALRGEDVSL